MLYIVISYHILSKYSTSQTWMAFVCLCKCVTSGDLPGLLRMTPSSSPKFETGGHYTSSQLQFAKKAKESLSLIVVSCYTTWLHIAFFLTILFFLESVANFCSLEDTKTKLLTSWWAVHSTNFQLHFEKDVHNAQSSFVTCCTFWSKVLFCNSNSSKVKRHF